MKHLNRRRMGRHQRATNSSAPQPNILSDTRRDLKNFLQSGPVQPADPLDLIFANEPLPPSALLDKVRLEPQEETPPVVEQHPPIPVGRECRLSESALFDIQNHYYSSAGVQAWQNSVPFYITSSTHVAENYADLILAFIDDYYQYLNLDEPLYIIEMATGTGRLSHLLLRELDNKRNYFAKARNLPIKYVMTDFAENNTKYWENHEKFKPYVESGLLDFAVFNPMVDTSFTLRCSGQTLSCDTLRNPIVAIANYFFDTIRQDVFRVENKRLHEGLISIMRNIPPGQSPPENPEELPAIHEVDCTYRYRELRNENYYPDQRLNNILRFYKHNLREGNVIMPIGGFDVLRNLQQMSSNRVVLLSSDKAYTNYELMGRMSAHSYAIHGGAFSYMVNYDAIGRYFEQGGGRWFKTHSDNWSLQTVCCIEMSQPGCEFERVHYVMEEKVQRLGTINTLCTMLVDRSNAAPMEQIEYLLSYIRINLADPKVFGIITDRLTPLLPNIQVVQRQELLELMDRAWQNFYHFPGEVNLPFALCQLYFVLLMHEKSIEHLDNTIKYYGGHETLYFLKGQNYEKLAQYEHARRMYEQALVLNPDFVEAKVCLEQLATIR